MKLSIIIYNLFFISITFITTQKVEFFLAPEEVVNLNDVKPTLLAEKALSRINTPLNPLEYGAKYLTGSKYIDDQQEFNINNIVKNNYTSKTCFIDRGKFIEYLNIIREKHSVGAISWDRNLETQTKIYASKIRDENKCKPPKDPKRNKIGEAIFFSQNRVTENEILQKWYKPAYLDYDFVNEYKNKKFDFEINYPMTIMLWDDTTNVGCTKVCCSTSELIVCHFYPPIFDHTLETMKAHLKPNKYLNINDNGPIKK